MKKKNIKLMAEFGTYPLWGMDDENLGYIELEDFKEISKTLKNELIDWSKEFYTYLDQNYPPDSIIPDSFNQKGFALWKKLQEELKDYNVYYMNYGDNKLHFPK